MNDTSDKSSAARYELPGQEQLLQEQHQPEPDAPIAIAMVTAPETVAAPAEAEEKQSFATNAWFTLLSVLLGLAFGTALSRSLVYLPVAITQQFVFKSFIMLKMFLGAAGTSSFVFALLHQVLPKKLELVRKRANTRGLVVVISGSLLLGVGMALGGACPGTLYVQAGAGVPTVPFALLGGLIGAYVYALLHSRVVSIMQLGALRVQRVDLLLGMSSLPINIAFGVLCWAFAFGLEAFRPWREDMPLKPGATCPQCWSPLLAGLMIGSLQLVASALLNTYIGTSTTYLIAVCLSRLVSPLQYVPGFRQLYQSESAHLACSNYDEHCFRMNKIWQVPFVIAAVFGSWFFGPNIDPSTLELSEPVVTSWTALIGGFFIVFGSRLSGGCTSGNGISSASLLSIPSLFAIVGMFGGAIITGTMLAYYFG